MKKNHYHDLSGERNNQLLIVVDRQGNPKGFATRDECHKGDGKTHLAFMAFVIDERGNIILTRRSKGKSLWDGYWDASVVSHVLPDETPESAAKRRGKEELGIEVDFRDLSAFYYFAKYKDNCENEYCHVLIGESSEEVDFNPVEIEEIKKITLAELKEEIKNNSELFTPWLKLALERVKIPKL